MRGRPTGTDVARLAGVSKSAVSRAFTGGIVSEEARTRILEAARQLKYRPSNTARSLTTSRSRMIGLAVTHLDNQFYPEVVERLSDRFAQAGYRLLLFVTHGEADLDPVLDELLGFRLDGVVLASSSLAVRVATECIEARVPVIMFNNVDPEGRIPGICADDVQGGALVARYLIAAGHDRFGIVTGLAQSTTSVLRLHGFREAVKAAGLPEPSVVSGKYTFGDAEAATNALLNQADPPNAIFCVNDHMAFGALHAVRSRGLLPGRDISVAGFDNVAISRWPLFSLTTIAQPLELMVEAIASELLDAIAGKPASGTARIFPGDLMVRASTRRAPGISPRADGEETWSLEQIING